MHAFISWMELVGVAIIPTFALVHLWWIQPWTSIQKNVVHHVFPTCTIITSIWWSIIPMTIMITLGLLPSPWVGYWLVIIRYVFKLGANLSNCPMVLVNLLSKIWCPTSSSTLDVLITSSTSKCSTIDYSFRHCVDPDGLKAIGTSIDFSSLCNWVDAR
jgi:hypothetical protein